jgi:FkbM family methyltransferase
MNPLSRLRNSILRKLERTQNPHTIDCVTARKWFERRRDIYEDLIPPAVPYVDPKGTIIDVGANIGFFSLLLMEKVKFTGNAYLFEPVPNLANLCKMTFKDTPYKVQVFDCALSDENGEIQFYTDREGNIGWNTLVVGETASKMEKITVKAKTFDSLGIKDRPSFIKVDVEGAEYKVFGGMLNSLKSWKPLPVILCEIGWGQSHPNWQQELSAFDELKKLGYDSYSMDKSKIDITSLKKTTDVLFLPRTA